MISDGDNQFAASLILVQLSDILSEQDVNEKRESFLSLNTDITLSAAVEELIQFSEQDISVGENTLDALPGVELDELRDMRKLWNLVKGKKPSELNKLFDQIFVRKGEAIVLRLDVAP